MKRVLSLLLFGLVILVPAALADSIGFDIGTGNVAISGYTGPYAHVDVNLAADGIHATITFTSLTNGGNIYLLGGAGAVFVNVNGASWTVGSFSASNSGIGFTPGPLSDGGSGNQSGFGVFNQTINSFGGYTNSSDEIIFILTLTSGTWANAASVLTPNADGHSAGAHIFVAASPADASSGALATGYAADGSNPPQELPEPTSLLLLGSGLLGVALLIRKRR